MPLRRHALTLDPWTPLSHKVPLNRADGAVLDGPSWLAPRDRRRLAAYALLRAYMGNVARAYLAELPDDVTDDRREYGDPNLLVAQTVAAVVGEEQTITVAAPDVDPAEPDELPVDGETSEDAAEREQRNADRATARAAVEREDWLRGWAADERLPLKLLETERNAVGLGDGVYLVAWDPARGRPRLTAVDPGFYFPVLPDGLTDDYPTRVHLAWEVEGDAERAIPPKLHRVTYELGPIAPATTEQTIGQRLRRAVPFLDDVEPPLLDGDVRLPDGSIGRRYPWQAADDEPSTVTCYMTEAEWELDDRNARDGVYDLSLSAATILRNGDGELLDRLDLRLDFLPVVHVPNSVALLDHFGTSSLSPVLQLLDELSSSDTDESSASATTGSPPIGVSGVSLGIDPATGRPVTLAMGPGEVWGLGENGRLSTVDTAPALDALANRVERLLTRLSTNTRLPASVLGRDVGAATSGYHLLLSFGPLSSMVRELRLARQEKYPLLLRFAQKAAMAGGQLPAGPVLDAELAFGPYLPTDLSSTIAEVRSLYEAKLLSLESALRRLAESGVDVGDVEDEAARIRATDYAAANLLADATGDAAAVRELLDLAPAAAVVVPPLVLPTPPPVPPSTPPAV